MTKQEALELEKKLLAEAWQVQDACNLSGVVHSFSRGLEKLWGIARVLGEGTDWVNRHPFSRLYADKVRDLTALSIETVDEAIQALEDQGILGGVNG